MKYLAPPNPGVGDAGSPGRARTPRRMIVTAVALWTALAVTAQDGPIAAETDGRVDGDPFAGFSMIAARNIFDRTRRSLPSRTPDAFSGPRRMQTLTLVGTMAYERGAFAFFDGSDPLFQKVLETGAEIADCRVGVVGPSGVTLESGGNSIMLQVGMQMRREENGAWEVAVPSAASQPPPEASAEPPGEDTDIIKRLMQKREQETK